MINTLNPNSNSWTRIYSLDLEGYKKELYGSYENYISNQLDIIVTECYKNGFCLRAITPYDNNWILVFTPQKPF